MVKRERPDPENLPKQIKTPTFGRTRPASGRNQKHRIRITICSLLLAVGPLLGGVKMRILEGRPVVDGVYVNGHGPYRFLVDTGTTSNHLEPKLARSIGLMATFRTELVSSAGVTLVPGNDGVEVTLGSMRAEGQMFLLAGLEPVHQLSPDIQGVLGQAFLSRFDYLLDLRSRRLEFGTFKFEGKGIRVPLRRSSGRPIVDTSLGPLLVDSGAAGVVVFSAGGGEVKYEMVTMSGSLRVGTVLTTLLIDGRALWHGEAVAVPRTEEVDVAGVLPISLFRAVYVCNSEGYILFDLNHD